MKEDLGGGDVDEETSEAMGDDKSSPILECAVSGSYVSEAGARAAAMQSADQ